MAYPFLSMVRRLSGPAGPFIPPDTYLAERTLHSTTSRTIARPPTSSNRVMHPDSKCLDEQWPLLFFQSSTLNTVRI